VEENFPVLGMKGSVGQFVETSDVPNIGANITTRR